MELLTSWAVSRKSPPTLLPMHCQVGSSVGTLNRYQTVSTEAVPVASLSRAEHAQKWALRRQMTGVGDCQPKGCSWLQAVQLVTGQEHLSRKRAFPAKFVWDRVTIQDWRTVTLRIQRCLAWSILCSWMLIGKVTLSFYSLPVILLILISQHCISILFPKASFFHSKWMMLWPLPVSSPFSGFSFTLSLPSTSSCSHPHCHWRHPTSENELNYLALDPFKFYV